MQLNKEKSINYIVFGIVSLFVIVIMTKVSLYFWRFDFFNLMHYKAFFKFISSGRILTSPKYIAFLMVLTGFSMCVYVALNEILKFDFSKLFKKTEVKDNNETIETNQNSKENLNQNVIEEQKQITQQPVVDNRYEIYNNPNRVMEQKNDVVNVDNNSNVNSLIDEEKEREKLQLRIKEVMENMKKKNIQNEEKVLNSQKDEKILTPLRETNKEEVIIPEKVSKLDMYFKNISDEQNALMENTLIAAGFRLLSEIRLGKTGIDYLATSKNGINIIQFDAKDGNWMANEDAVSGEEAFWYAEDDKKLSPVSRALDAKNIIENLIKGVVDLPVNAYVCLGGGNIMNYFDMQSKWHELGVDIIKLSSNDSIDDIESLEEVFPPQSQEDVDEKVMNDLIDVLEKAELPE